MSARINPHRSQTWKLFGDKLMRMATHPSALFMALVGAEVRAWNALDAALRDAGNPLSLGRFLVLRTVRDTPACRIQEVAASQGITVGAASRLVERLDPCEHDRRATILTVTPLGMDNLAAAQTIVDAKQARLFAPLSPDQREHLARALTLIDEAGDPSWKDAPAARANRKGRA